MYRYLLPAAALALAGCSQDAAAPPADAKPSPDREGLTWTHKELLAHLKARGVRFEQSERNPSVIGDGKDNAVLVQLHPDGRRAKDAAGLMPAERAFAWGRFLFVTGPDEDPAFLTAVKKALD